jgi:4-amino-4-deoxy-L-arabinose transferase-like glycosyltransferase
VELLSFVLASVVAILPIGVGGLILRLVRQEITGDLMLGLAGLVGLGTVGTLFGILFLVPGAVALWSVLVICFACSVCTGIWFKGLPKNPVPKAQKPVYNITTLFCCIAILLGLVALVGVLTPSTSLDWDSLAYHLAVPQLWIQAKHASSISFIHHSNFPGAVDSWFTVGQLIGGQTAAKTFTWWFTVYGTVAIIGFIRERFSVTTSWLCGLAFASIPMVMWESGTAYIDVANGLFAGFGFVFAALYVEKREKSDMLLAAVLLSLAAGSKYTGLQAIFIACLVVLILIDRAEKVGAAQLGSLAAGLSNFWYFKNWIQVGNPVYPFFYSVLGGKNWDTFNGQIYSDEQKTFGYQGALNLGQSVFGLVTSPGRFTNPGPSAGTGFAFVSLGFAVFAGALIGIIKGLVSRFDKALALMILIQLLAWFALSQQSRYILTLVVPMLFFVANAIEWKPVGKIVIGSVVVQIIASIWISTNSGSLFAERLPVLIGAITRDEFLGGYKLEDGSSVPGHVETYTLSKYVDNDSSVIKVGLFDEVFGYYLNKPYFWATPGHTTELDYAHITTSDDLATNLKKLGISHAYITNKFIRGTEEETLFLRVSGLSGQAPMPYSAEERSKRMEDQRNKWRVLFAEAIASKKFTLVNAFSKTRFLFKIE